MKVQIFSPHPDDHDLFMGGTFLKHIYNGDEVQVILMSDGEHGTRNKQLEGKKLAHKRDKEIIKRLDMLPGKIDLIRLQIEDGRVKANHDTLNKIKKLITEFSPETLYVPESAGLDSWYLHPDHQTTGQLVEMALEEIKPPKELRYYHSNIANHYEDITPYYRESLNALKAYKSQRSFWAPIPFLVPIFNLKQKYHLRKWGRKIGVKYAEAFRVAKL